MAELSTTARNEQIKLAATYLNGAAIAALAVGCFAPITAVVMSTAQPNPGRFIGLIGCWIILSFVLHFGARRILHLVE
jgi:Na+-driven multidrug efflux pump